MTIQIQEKLMASFRDLELDDVMTITIHDEGVMCEPKGCNNTTFNQDVERLVRAWQQIVNQHGLYIDHTKVRQGGSLLIRFCHIAE